MAGVPEDATASWARRLRSERTPSSQVAHLQLCEQFFDHYAGQVELWRKRNRGYHNSLASLARFYIPPHMKVLELGCGPGDLLAAVRPAEGVGIDISAGMVDLARRRHPDLEFHRMVAEEIDLDGRRFDYIILSDLIGFLYDIRGVLDRLHALCHRDTRIVINWYSRVWQPALNLAERLGLKYPQPILNWTAPGDVLNLLHLAGFEAIRHRRHTLLPLRIPLLAAFANRCLANLPLFRSFALLNFVVARSLHALPETPPPVTVVCPCRNEAGNIETIARRLPAMGSHTELIFVEGHSTDGTLEECGRVAALFPARDIRVLQQSGRGKGDAVRLGFAQARGDILMILDADASVDPEDLAQFYQAITAGKGEFLNGCRLVYAMDPKAMRFLNLVGNRFFAWLLGTMMGQPLKDSLCGAKVLWKASYERIAAGRAHFGHLDPFGDFDLLFGAAKLNLSIVEIPVRYRRRIYGETNISRFSDGLLLLRMSARAAAELYFIA